MTLDKTVINGLLTLPQLHPKKIKYFLSPPTFLFFPLIILFFPKIEREKERDNSKKMSFINKFIDKAKGSSRHQAENASHKDTKSVESSSHSDVTMVTHNLKPTSSQDDQVHGN